MKNLNKKIGAVALAAMVLAGGVAASGVKSFAAGQASSIQREVIENDENVKEIMRALADLSGKKYQVLKIVNSKQDVKSELKSGVGASYVKSCLNYVPSIINKGQLPKKLRGFLMYDSFGFIYKNKAYVIGVERFK